MKILSVYDSRWTAFDHGYYHLLGREEINSKIYEIYYKNSDDTETMGGIPCATHYAVLRENGKIVDVLKKDILYKGDVEEETEWYDFCQNDDNKTPLCGELGVALVRNREIIDSMAFGRH